MALKAKLSLMPRPCLHHSLGPTEPLLLSGEPEYPGPPGIPVQDPPPFNWGPWGKAGCKRWNCEAAVGTGPEVRG